MYKCLKCGYESADMDFIDDYIYDEEQDDELAVFKCPNCGNDDSEFIIDKDLEDLMSREE